jgi:acyl dehydratase
MMGWSLEMPLSSTNKREAKRRPARIEHTGRPEDAMRFATAAAVAVREPEIKPIARVAVGDSFSKHVRFDAAGIAAFARSTGDTNPLHHDPAYAATTRFGGIIASGSHVSALLMGMVAGHFADQGMNVGLDFCFKFQAPVRVNDTVEMRWRVTQSMPKLSLKGDIVTLEGEAIRSDGIVAVAATAHALLFRS